LTLLNPHALFLLPLAALLWFLEFRGVSLSRAWASAWLSTQGSRLGFRAALHPWLVSLSFLCLTLALARPVWDPVNVDRKSSGQDTVFLVDASRSMNTVDVSGSSRLDAVKLALLDLLNGIDGDRVALVAFAGTSVAKCPLTLDYAFFAQAVKNLDAGSASRGGTLLGDALREVRKDFSAPGKKLSVWVFTDGGDQESFPVEAAKEYADAGVSLVVWGVGTLSGGEVPERGVTSALNENLLREVAEAAPGGAYFGSAVPLWTLPTEYRARHRRDAVATSSRVVWREGAWFLLWPALALFACDLGLRLSSSGVEITGFARALARRFRRKGDREK